MRKVSTIVTTSICIFLILIGCHNYENQKMKRLDNNRGVKGLVLGDSLYEDIFEKHRNSSSLDDVIETNVWGYVLSSGMKVEFGDRFLYGVERGRVTANAVDGQIWAYLIKTIIFLPSEQKRLKIHSLTSSDSPLTC